MPNAYQLLSIVAFFAIPVAIITGIMVEYLRDCKKTGSKDYIRVLRIRNLEIYLLGIIYPIKAILAYFTPAFQLWDVLLGILWLLLAVYVFRKYRFGHDAAK